MPPVNKQIDGVMKINSFKQYLRKHFYTDEFYFLLDFGGISSLQVQPRSSASTTQVLFTAITGNGSSGTIIQMGWDRKYSWGSRKW